MPVVSKALRQPIDARREFVFNSLEPKRKYTCAEVCELTGLTMNHVRAAMLALCDGGAVKQKGFVETPTHNGGHNKTALYLLTGQPYNHELAALKHRQQQSKYHATEPSGRLVEKPIPNVPGGRVIRFGRDYKIGKGQSTAVLLTAGSVLNSIC